MQLSGRIKRNFVVDSKMHQFYNIYFASYLEIDRHIIQSRIHLGKNKLQVLHFAKYVPTLNNLRPCKMNHCVMRKGAFESNSTFASAPRLT